MEHIFKGRKTIQELDLTSAPFDKYNKQNVRVVLGSSKKSPKDFMPLRITCTYRAYKNKVHVASLIIDYNFHLKFNYEENPFDDIITMLTAICVHIYNESFTIAYGETMDLDKVTEIIDPDTNKELAIKIIEKATSLNLLKPSKS